MTAISKCDEFLPESAAGTTEQNVATTKSEIITLDKDVCHSTKSQYFLNTLHKEMVNQVLGPGAPDHGAPGERITNGNGIVLQHKISGLSETK